MPGCYPISACPWAAATRHWVGNIWSTPASRCDSGLLQSAACSVKESIHTDIHICLGRCLCGCLGVFVRVQGGGVHICSELTCIPPHAYMIWAVINMSPHRRSSMADEAHSYFWGRGKEGCECAAKGNLSTSVLSGCDHPACRSLLLNIRGERWYPGTLSWVDGSVFVFSMLWQHHFIFSPVKNPWLEGLL